MRRSFSRATAAARWWRRRGVRPQTTGRSYVARGLVLKRPGLTAVVAAFGALVLAGCYAQTEPASDVGSNSATLNAHGFTTGKQAQAFFQYSSAKNALGTGFGLQTPTLTFPPNASGPFTAKVSGLSPGTNYWFRVCGNDVGDQPFCNSDLEFTTVVPGAAAAFAPALATGGDVVEAVGDFNGDEISDLVVLTLSSPDRIEILLGNGDATFTRAGTVTGGSFLGPLAVGDFNRDGNLDVILGPSSANQPFEVFPGRGDGTFGAPILTPATTSIAFSQQLVPGDFNRDGKLDIAVIAARGGRSANVLQVMLGNGNGTFQPPDQTFVATGADTPQWTGMAVGDFNRDQRPDIALSKQFCPSSPSDCGVSVFLGNGNGTFGPEHVFDAGHEDRTVIVGDFNADGKLDLATTTVGTGPTILSGNGDGTFNVRATYTGQDTPVATTDVNADGKLDLVEGLSSGSGGQSTFVRLGNGDATFQNPTTVNDTCGVLAVADFNDDTKPDIACNPNPSGPGSNAVLLNATPPPG
jgi:FG-GAP-like repeat